MGNRFLSVSSSTTHLALSLLGWHLPVLRILCSCLVWDGGGRQSVLMTKYIYISVILLYCWLVNGIVSHAFKFLILHSRFSITPSMSLFTSMSFSITKGATVFIQSFATIFIIYFNSLIGFSFFLDLSPIPSPVLPNKTQL